MKMIVYLFIIVHVILGTLANVSVADDWPQWRGPNRDGIWRETGIIQSFNLDRLEPVWRANIGSGYSGPTVANGRVFVTDRLVQPKQVERIHCFDESTGKKLWTYAYDCPYKIDYDAGPRASVTLHQGKAYALGAMGHLHCLNVKTGEVIWQRDLNKEYAIRMPIWGISAAPLIVDDMVILHIGGANHACMVALDTETGSERWRALPDEASYSAPILIEQAGKPVIVQYTGSRVVGLNPQNGKKHWAIPFPPRQMVIGIADPVLQGDKLFITNFFDGSLLIQLSKDQLRARKIWQRAGKSERETDALHSIISTPLLEGDFIYGVDSYGELRCLDLDTGDRIWESLEAGPKARWATIHLVKQGDRVWMFNERGELIIARLSPQGYEEISRAKLIDPTREQLPSRRGGVTWAHPAFANKKIFVRNDQELICVDLSAK